VRRPPSDFELLKAIYEYHRGDYTASRIDRPTRAGVMIPIDITAIAATLDTDDDTVFGRLYHHLDRVYGEEERDDGRGRRALFTPLAGNEPNCINFPLLEAVLAGLWQERDRQLWTFWASLISISIALAALIVSIVVAIVTA
jgi:hypothetical protein